MIKINSMNFDLHLRLFLSFRDLDISLLDLV
jgi:hypothetical protein